MRLPQKLSLVAQTAVVLREQIAAGNWVRLLPSEGELCEKLHVSRVTLRAALGELQREGWVRSHQGRRREVVKQRRRLAAETSRRVALLTPSPLHALSPNALFWIDALREYLAEADYHLDLQVSRVAYGPGPEQVLKNLAEHARPVGWVLYKATEPMQRWFAGRKLPCVITGTRHPNVALPSVDIAYRAVCRHAVGLFLARGHQRLALLNPASGLSGDVESELGFNEAACHSGRSGVEAQVIRHDGTVSGLCKQLDHLLRRQPPPTAFLVSRAEHVLTVASYLLHRSLTVSRAALISRDDALFLENLVPSIARYAFDPRIFARKISKAVLDMVHGEQVKLADHQIMPRFVPGETLG